jgi:hypothetical protein
VRPRIAGPASSAGPVALRGLLSLRGIEADMRAMFFTYLVVIVGGLSFFTIVGLTNH